MDHDEPDAISAMIKYLYTGDYNTETNTIDMQSHLKVYTLADKLDIPALKTVAEDKFKAGTEVDWKDATFPACVKTVYEITPPGPGGKRLRSITAIIAGKHAKEFFKLSTAFHKMMTEVAEFGADLAQVLCGSYVELIAAVPGPTSPDRWGRVWCYRCHEYWFPNRLTGECTNRCGSQIV
jgi:speckle-type POZ protein